MNKSIKQIFFFCFLLLCFSCIKKEINTSVKDHPNICAFNDIKMRGKLKVIMEYNSINYFIYRGKPMGFQYELIKRFAEHLGVGLDIQVSNNLSESFKLLKHNRCHILANSITYTENRSKEYILTTPIVKTNQVLIQRKRDENDTINYISEIKDIDNKKIFVKGNSGYISEINKLSKNNNLNVDIISCHNFNTEELIRQVSKGKIDYTLADHNIAHLNSRYYTNIDLSLSISQPLNISWAINKESFLLANEINQWLEDFKKTATYWIIYEKYYKSERAVRIFHSSYYYLNSGKISNYDSIIKKESKNIGWDWKLLAALIYQESRFDPEAESWAGAYGLMQIMPETAETFNITNYKLPKNNIKAGSRYINYLDKTLRKHLKDTSDIVKFILASYNVGAGHVLDARRLAIKYGKNPDKWYNNTDIYLLKKSDPFYYKDTLSRYGYCRGMETYNFVYEIMDRYDHYINIIKE